jgi:NADH dehydrogenase
MKVVIIGAGFGGLTAARKLSMHKDLEVTIVDKQPYQLFSPLLYQVATGGLPEDDIAYPVRAAIPGVSFIRGEVTKINEKEKSITLADQAVIEFDQLVLAAGSTGTTYGVPGVQENALQMKSIKEARAIKKKLLGMYEEVEAGHKPKESLKVVVIGAGPTGVEISGAVAELQKSMRHEFPKLYKFASVTLVEAGPRVLPMFHEKSSKHAESELGEIGVIVKTNSAVDRMYETDVHLKNEEVLSGGTLIWAAGVAAHSTWTGLGETDRANRIKVNKFLQTDSGVFVIGDGAHLMFKDQPLPMVAPVALQMGRHVAKQIVNIKNNKELVAFKYKDKGQMATIGRRRAVVEMPGGFRLHGTIAWLTWLALHVFYLAGGRNRISVVADWMWNYIAWGIGPRRTVID